MSGQDFRDYGAHERKRWQVGASALAFALQPAVRERGEEDVALPPWQGAPFEVVEASSSLSS